LSGASATRRPSGAASLGSRTCLSTGAAIGRSRCSASARARTPSLNVGYAEAAVDEARREVLLNYVKGPFRGVVKNYVADGVLVSDWDITINALFIPLKPWISSHFRKGAERALERLTSP